MTSATHTDQTTANSTDSWATFDDRGAARDFAGRPMPRAGAGEEELRFIRNFHDVFLSIGLAILIAGIGFVSLLILGELLSINEFEDLQRAGWTVACVMAVDAALMWLLAESFARRRRLFLPAIVILIGFAGFVFWGVMAAYLTTVAGQDIQVDNVQDTLLQLRWAPAILFGATGAAIFAYYARMKLPFAMGLACLTIVMGGAYTYLTFTTNVTAVEAAPAQFIARLSWLQLWGGIFLFVLGMAFDARDPLRRNRYSDNAFWLHFFAAPAIFGGTLAIVAGNPLRGAFSFDAASAAITLMIVFIFAIVSLLINRRALLVSGLISAAVAIAVLVNETGLSGGWVAAVTLLVLGGAMVLLGGGWHTARRLLTGGLPKEGVIARIIPPEPDPEDPAAARAGDE